MEPRGADRTPSPPPPVVKRRDAEALVPLHFFSPTTVLHDPVFKNTAQSWRKAFKILNGHSLHYGRAISCIVTNDIKAFYRWVEFRTLDVSTGNALISRIQRCAELQTKRVRSRARPRRPNAHPQLFNIIDKARLTRLHIDVRRVTEVVERQARGDEAKAPHLVCPFPLCRRSFEAAEPLRRHLELHSGGAHRYMCPFCDALFKDATAMAAHSIKHLPRERGHPAQRCPLCQAVCSSHAQLKGHIFRDHRDCLPEDSSATDDVHDFDLCAAE